MPVPLVYRKGNDIQNVNYNWTDIAEGTGIVALEGFSSEISGAYVLNLDKNAMNNTADGDAVRYADISSGVTFSLGAFNLPKVVSGKGYVNFTWVLKDNGDPVTYGYVKVDFLKNGSVIGTGQTQVYTATGTGVFVVQTSAVAINVTKTNFKRGDIFGVKFTSYYSGNSNTVYLHYDPENRDFGGTPAVTAADNTTQLKVYVPFQIDN